jgi:hypothetical protein
MLYKEGKYLNVCGFKLCGIDFYGRLNQLYCASACKQAHNNSKSSMVRKLANGADLKIRKATRISMDLFKPDNEGKSTIHKVDLISKAFPFDLPTTKIKDDRYDGVMFCFGSFCFYQKGEYFIFYKI